MSLGPRPFNCEKKHLRFSPQISSVPRGASLPLASLEKMSLFASSSRKGSVTVACIHKSMLLPPLLGLRSFSSPKRMDTFSDMMGRQDTTGHRKGKSSLTRIKGVDQEGPAPKPSGARTHAASCAPARVVISCGRHRPSARPKVLHSHLALEKKAHMQ